MSYPIVCNLNDKYSTVEYVIYKIFSIDYHQILLI